MPRYKPAQTTAWRSWESPTEHRTLLLNQQQREFLLLEDVSSRLWQQVCEMAVAEAEAAARLGLEEADVLGFLDELHQEGLVASTAAEMPSPVPAFPSSLFDTSDMIESPASADLEKECMAWAEQQGFIYSAHWEVTYRCNELCVHCYNPGAAHAPDEIPQRQTNELSTAEASDMLHQLVQLGVFRLTLSGGEATLRKDFLELLQQARSLGFQVVIYTNGLKLDKEYLQRIAACYPWSVEFSVYSATPAQHDAVTRVPGSFAKTMASLQFFRQHGIHTVFKTMLTKQTIGQWQHTQQLGEGSAERIIISTMIAPGVDGKRAPLETTAEFGELVVLAATPGSPLYVGDQTQSWGYMPLPKASQKPCSAGHGSIAITPEGTIYPCISFPMPIGEVRAGDLFRLKRQSSTEVTPVRSFTAANREELLDQWRAVRMGDLSECGSHERCHYCGDICPGDAFVQTGDPLRAAENHCRHAYARMTASKHLQAGLSLDDLHKKFGVPAEFGRTTVQPIIPLHLIG